MKWDLRFLELAKHISSWSKDPSTKVGAVIVDDKKRIVSLGYNGFPIGINDSHEKLENRETKLKIIVHAERNAIIFANRSLDGCTLYTYPFMPCSVCAGIVIQSGIKRVVSYQTSNKRWIDDFVVTMDMFDESGVELILYEDTT